MSRRSSRVAEWALPVFAVLAAFLLLELYVRIFPWTPRVQVVRKHGLRDLNGAPVWGDETRTNRECAERHPERTRVAFFGSSITWGSGVQADETFTAGLQAHLNALQPTPGFCVLNFAQPGFQLQQKAAVAQVEIPRYRPALVLWESWSEWRQFRVLGDAAIAVSDFHIRPDGFIGIAGVPDALNRELFLHSRLYQYAVLELGQLNRELPAERDLILGLTPALRSVVETTRTGGGKFFVYFAPPLDRPFRESAEAPDQGHAVWADFLREVGVSHLTLARELIARDHVELRFDPCCHFNAAGHRALVDVMARVILEQLGGPAGSASNPPILPVARPDGLR